MNTSDLSHSTARRHTIDIPHRLDCAVLSKRTNTMLDLRATAIRLVDTHSLRRWLSEIHLLPKESYGGELIEHSSGSD
jgi:hypothetical protein